MHNNRQQSYKPETLIKNILSFLILLGKKIGVPHSEDDYKQNSISQLDSEGIPSQATLCLEGSLRSTTTTSTKTPQNNDIIG